jgi:hypothetical protein
MTPSFSYISVIIPPLKRDWPFIRTNLNYLHQRIICTKFDWFWPAGFGEKDFSQFSVYFYYFATISPWLSLSFKDTWILSILGWFVPRLVKISPVVLEKKIFIWPHPIFFLFFVIISPLKRSWPFIWTNLNPLHPRMICAKFDWFWPAGSGEDLKKKISVF